MFVGCVGFGYVADRLGRRSIFVFSLLWYSICTAIMAFQTTAAGVDLWRFIAGIGVGLEQVTIDTFLPEIVPPQAAAEAFAFYQFVEFCAVPVVALLGWLLVPLHPLGLDGWRWVALIGSLGAIVVWWLRRGTSGEPPLAGRAWTRRGSRPGAGPARSPRRSRYRIAPSEPVNAARQRRPRAEAASANCSARPMRAAPLVLSVFNLMQTVAFYGFGSWVPTLLIAKGILVTTSQMYAFIIAIANPDRPAAGDAGGGPDGAQVADRLCRRRHRRLRHAVREPGQPGAGDRLRRGGDASNNWMSFAFHNYQGELFPTRVRARAVGFVYSWSRVSATFASLMINFLLIRGGAPAVAAFIAAAMVVMTVTIGGFGPKTRRLTLEEISQ